MTKIFLFLPMIFIYCYSFTLPSDDEVFEAIAPIDKLEQIGSNLIHICNDLINYTDCIKPSFDCKTNLNSAELFVCQSRFLGIVDNFFYTEAYNRDMIDLREKYPNMSDDDYLHSNWDKYRFWVMATQKGTQYFDEILSPRFYEKYKDLSVEIDSKGKILRWIGEIRR